MPIKIILLGEPMSTNSVYKHVVRGRYASVYMPEKARMLKQAYWWQTKSQYKGEVLTGPLEIEVTIYFGTKRVQDWDNFHKLSMDAMTGLVWEDDSQIQAAHVRKAYDKDNPRIEVVIHRL